MLVIISKAIFAWNCLNSNEMELSVVISQIDNFVKEIFLTYVKGFAFLETSVIAIVEKYFWSY